MIGDFYEFGRIVFSFVSELYGNIPFILVAASILIQRATATVYEFVYVYMDLACRLIYMSIE